MELTVLPPDDGSTSLSRLWDAILFCGPVEFAGLLAIALALALLVGSPYLAKRPRHFLMLIVAAALIGAAGYVAFDYRYVIVNLTMRDAAQVRADCEKLLGQARIAGNAFTLSSDTDPNFPASFKKLGAVSADASGEGVFISLGFDSYLYSPKDAWTDATGPRSSGGYGGSRCRRTLYRDFYHYTPNSE